jgi:hypothetical protein
MSLIYCFNLSSSHSSTSLCSDFRNRLTHNNFDSLLPRRLDRRIYGTKFPIHVSFLFSIFYLSYHSNISFDAQKFPFIRDCSYVIMLQVEGDFKHKVNYRYFCHLRGLEFMYLPESVECLCSQGQGDGWSLTLAYILENYIGEDNWQCRYIWSRWSYACRTKQGRKTRAVRRISWYQRRYTAMPQPKSRTKQSLTVFSSRYSN